MQIGAQLFTCKPHTQTLEDFEQTLRKVSEIGYRSVQVSGTCAFEPEWLRDRLAENGLVCPVTHVPYVRIVEETETVVKQHAVFGCSRIGLGSLKPEMRKDAAGYEAFRKAMLPAALKMRDMGVKFCYHNHDWDFQPLEGKSIIQRILEDFPEDSVDFILDLGWADFAGQDVIKLMNDLKGRISCIHLKDYADLPEDGSITTKIYMKPIYEGKVDYDSYIKELPKVGCEYMLVEQDYCYDESPFECLRRSYVNVTARFPETK